MNQPAVPDEAREVQLGHFDPYKLDPSHILEPPTSFGQIVRQTGPGIVLAASIVGSGELILTTTLGAKVGYTFMWMILLSCLIKSVVQACLGRYAIATAETGLDAVNRIPGPRWRVSWVVWAWAAMVFMTLFQITGMFIGVSQTMNSVFAGISVRIWVFFFLILTLVLLLGGAYHRIERLAMVKVGLFTLITLMAAVLLLSSPDFSGAEVARGLIPRIPADGLAVAVGVFGITGVGAVELYVYTYWCVEKGYARYTGPREDSEAWRRRARGWIRVMNFDVIGSMFIYTIATVAFYMLGAGVLSKMGLVPSGKEMIATLTHIYTETFGGWARWVFYAGAIVVLYGTIVAATAGNARMFSDFMRLQGAFHHDDYKARLRWRDIFIVVLLVIPVVFFLVIGEAPVEMVTWGAIAQALMLPIISFATLFLVYKHLPQEVAVPSWLLVLLWLGAIVITVIVVPGLYLELSKIMK